MKLVIFFLATLAVCVSSMGRFEDMAQDMDRLLEILHKPASSNPEKHRLSRHRIYEPLLTIGSKDFDYINTQEIELEGIEKLTRTSVAPGVRALGGFGSHPPSNVIYVEFAVKGGINMTSKNFEFTHEGKQHSARFMARWRDSSKDAEFRLTGVSFNGVSNFNVGSVTSNIEKNKFELTLTCNDSQDQSLCDQLQVNYLNSWKFDIHTFIQKVFDTEIGQISSKKA